MPSPEKTSLSASFQEWLDRLARPIEFAAKDGGAHAGAVKNLGPFVAGQVEAVLAQPGLSPSVQTRLQFLRELFIDFPSTLSPSEQQRRLSTASAVLVRLRLGGEDSVDSAEGQATQGVSQVPPGREDVWNCSIQYVKGVGPKRMALLQRLGIATAEDALWTIPWRYEDRSELTPIGKLVPGMEASICGTVARCQAKRARTRRLSIVEVGVEDETGRLQVVFFNQPYLEQVLAVGTRVLMSGRVSAGPQGWTVPRLEVAQYEVIGNAGEDGLHVGRIVPVYHETKGWTSRQARVLVKALLDQHGSALRDLLPVGLRARLRLMPVQEALHEVHFPKTGTELSLLERGQTPAHRRLAFEELFLLQLALAVRQRSVQAEPKAMTFNPRALLLAQLGRSLPFRLTGAQERVIQEIVGDMASSSPMNRLVQGDVGSGKTVVALHAIVMACGSGYQAALMAPTEILAEQHYRNLRGTLERLGLAVVLMRGSDKAAVKKTQAAQLASGEMSVAIGTHALIQKGVGFKQLGLVVIDEQHKFGVLQRKTLIEKGYKPDVLVLTATPIPRTLAMTAYGDLDVSIIDQLPPGRQPIRTMLFTEPQRRRAYQILTDELRNQRQAYVVYPLVEESEKTDLQAAMQAAEQLQQGPFADFRVGLLHGRMKPTEKEAVMAAFKSGAIHLLVATTVVEVGVDVPNATIMMIEHAERFGLAQLHQLRGRVGRGAAQSYCLLMAAGLWRSGQAKRQAVASGAESLPTAKERLDALVRSTDGFVIAEEDLRIRGPGEFLGVRQWGLPEFKVANLARDGELLQQARREAFALLETDPSFRAPGHQALKAAMLRKWEQKLELGSIS